MPTRIQRSKPIEPRVQPIKGSVAAPPVPGDRGVVEQPGEGNDGRRSDASTHHRGTAVAAIHGGPIERKTLVRARY
jgi:hypothetical protein